MSDTKKLTKEDIRKIVGLPMQIYGTLTYVGMSPEGELVLYIKKDNQYKLREFAKSLKLMENRELYVLLDEGNWS